MDYELKVEMVDEGGYLATSRYDLFRLEAAPFYNLTVGNYVYQGGSAEGGDSLSIYNGSAFYLSDDNTTADLGVDCTANTMAPGW